MLGLVGGLNVERMLLVGWVELLVVIFFILMCVWIVNLCGFGMWFCWRFIDLRVLFFVIVNCVWIRLILVIFLVMVCFICKCVFVLMKMNFCWFCWIKYLNVLSFLYFIVLVMCMVEVIRLFWSLLLREGVGVILIIFWFCFCKE